MDNTVASTKPSGRSESRSVFGRNAPGQCYVVHARPHLEWQVHDLARATLRARRVISFLEG